jgi:hypothetical protein
VTEAIDRMVAAKAEELTAIYQSSPHSDEIARIARTCIYEGIALAHEIQQALQRETQVSV